ncbi:hypothetical protein JTE90_001377 [Oedothorax gibbosus]|uniref:N-acetyltransferase domain-containing protein n=1 Tax=Oedothorax gibbosus TaxID=931172 RepID=A0AAV6VGX6_9ARAC|nr:hypothetical protein JTE90_001377 [Oedothorax gibbosus]
MNSHTNVTDYRISGKTSIKELEYHAIMGEVSYTIRKMTREDVPGTLDVCLDTGLQEGTHCLYTWLEVDKDAVNIAVKDTGEIIGACSAVIHHEDMAFLGMYGVRKAYQGLGIGMKLWNACVEHIGTRNGILNAVPDKTDRYRTKGGFPILETSWASIMNETCNPVNHEVLSDEPPEGIDILPFQESHLPAMFEYDLALMGYEREKALELNCKEQDSRTFVAFNNRCVVGFGTIKMRCDNALGQVGPLYADDPRVAEVILKRLIVSLPKAEGFAMMTVNSNLAAKKLIDRLGCPVLMECPRLYSKARFNVDLDKVFAHFDLNFTPF